MATNPTIQDYTKYAALQMAAEAIIESDEYAGTRLRDALIRGNKRNSRFAATQAADFAKHWKVIEQRSTTTGFSGTLFECTADDPVTGAKKGETVLSFRSTEFLDDAARDNYATNTLEIYKTGYAWGQIADMESWYSELKAAGKVPSLNQLSVTGYSLGGHLATVFNMLRKEEGTALPKAVITYNSAGVGGIAEGHSVSSLLATFKQMSSAGYDHAARFTNLTLREIYQRMNAALQSGKLPYSTDIGALSRLSRPNSEEAVDLQTQAEAGLLLDAYENVLKIVKQATRVPNLQSGVEGMLSPAKVPVDQIRQAQLGYQLALMEADKYADGAGLLKGIARMFGDKVIKERYQNQFDVVGQATSSSSDPSMVANSQWHIGEDVKVIIEDQPLYRGGKLVEVLAKAILTFDIELLENDFGNYDFGDTHSLMLLMDSLSVQNSYMQLLPENQWQGFGAQFNTLFKRATNQIRINGAALIGKDPGKAEGNALESMVNALAYLMLGPRGRKDDGPVLSGSPEGNTWHLLQDQSTKAGEYSGRNALHQRLEELQKSQLYQYLAEQARQGHNLFKLLTPSVSELAQKAQTSFAAYAALHGLSPAIFELPQDNEQFESRLAAVWGQTYEQWQEDKQTRQRIGFDDEDTPLNLGKHRIDLSVIAGYFARSVAANDTLTQARLAA